MNRNGVFDGVGDGRRGGSTQVFAMPLTLWQALPPCSPEPSGN
jgi:hypothetical protein